MFSLSIFPSPTLSEIILNSLKFTLVSDEARELQDIPSQRRNNEPRDLDRNNVASMVKKKKIEGIERVRMQRKERMEQKK